MKLSLFQTNDTLIIINRYHTGSCCVSRALVNKLEINQLNLKTDARGKSLVFDHFLVPGVK